jgi:hypothetical protein
MAFMNTPRLKSRRSRVLVAVLASAAITTPFVTTPVSGPDTALACEKAKIGGKTKCIAAGQFCARANQKDYKKHGYSCSKKDKNGRYHLVEA